VYQSPEFPRQCHISQAIRATNPPAAAARPANTGIWLPAGAEFPVTVAAVLDAALDTEEAALEALEGAEEAEEAADLVEEPAPPAAVVVTEEEPVEVALAAEVVLSSEEVDAAAAIVVAVPPVGLAGAEAFATFPAAFT